MKIIKRLFFKFMLLASTHCTVVVGVDAHFTMSPSLNPMHPDIESGREIERFATGGIRISTDYNEMGLVSSRHVHSGERHTGWRHYRWDVGARLLSMRCSMRKEPVIYAYDEMCRLIRGEYSLLESIFRTPDKVGNLYRASECKGRRYDRGGRLLWDGEYHYSYDCEGDLVHKSRRDINGGTGTAENSENGHTGDTVGKKKAGWFSLLFGSDEDNKDKSRETDPFLEWQPGDTCYFWLANGMLGSVLTPEGKTVYFGYDALGRRVSKTVEGTVRRYGWDGNVLLHEWDISEADRPKLVKDDSGREVYNGTEKPENLVTWIYDGMSFTPVVKVTEQERYTIIHDYLGTSTQAYDGNGELVWEMVLDVYGEVNECNGERTLIPFRYQGQYEDEETGLYYNRFRYYSPQMGMYISQDPIGLAGNNPTLYGYVEDTNIWLDIFGLLNEFGIAGYGNPLHAKDSFTAHELLQNAWLKNNNIISSRSSGIATSNPAIALQESMHKRISKLQADYGLHNPNVLKNQTALQNINRNAALTRRGIYEDLLSRGWEPANAKAFATEKVIKLRDEAIDFANNNGLIKGCH